MIVASLSPATGPLLAAAALLVLAGVAKVRRPAPTGLAMARLGLPGSDRVVRALGALEVLAALVATMIGGWAALPVAVLYLGFALVSMAQLRRAAATGEAADCGCFGDQSAPLGWSHVAVDVTLAGAAGLAVLVGAGGLVAGLVDTPAATAVVAALAALAAWGIEAILTDLPALRALRRTDEAPS